MRAINIHTIEFNSSNNYREEKFNEHDFDAIKHGIPFEVTYFI